MRLRQLIQFRLRSLLFVMVPVAMAMALLGHQVHESRRQRAVVESLMSRGADVRFSSDASNPFEWLDTGYASRVTIVKHLLTGNPDLSPLAELKNLEELVIDGTQVSDLSPLAGLTNLQQLFVTGNRVSDLSPLAGLKNLEMLAIHGRQVSDVSSLAGLTNLERLSLSWTQVSDLSPLTELTNLQELAIAETPVSDLSPLAELKNLRRILVDGTQVSDEQAVFLRRVLPNCEVVKIGWSKPQ